MSIEWFSLESPSFQDGRENLDRVHAVSELMDAASRYSAILDPDTLVSMIPEREDPSDPTEGLAHDIARFHILLASGSDLTGNSGIAA